jgi:hypothetical protein
MPVTGLRAFHPPISGKDSGAAAFTIPSRLKQLRRLRLMFQVKRQSHRLWFFQSRKPKRTTGRNAAAVNGGGDEGALPWQHEAAAPASSTHWRLPVHFTVNVPSRARAIGSNYSSSHLNTRSSAQTITAMSQQNSRSESLNVIFTP